jgi:hypothetical protein
MNDPSKPRLAPQDRVTRLAPYVQRVLAALGYGRVLVTDESLVGDFFESQLLGDGGPEAAAQRPNDDARLAVASAELGVALSYDDFIADVAERLPGGQ